MHSIQPNAIDDCSVCLSSVIQSVSCLPRPHCAKNGSTDRDLFGVNSLGGPRNIALDECYDVPNKEGKLGKISPTVDPCKSQKWLTVET